MINSPSPKIGRRPDDLLENLDAQLLYQLALSVGSHIAAALLVAAVMWAELIEKVNRMEERKNEIGN